MKDKTKGAHARRVPVAALLALALLAGCGQNNATSQGDGTTGTPPGSAAASVAVQQSEERPVVGGKIVYALAAETNGWNLASNQFSSPGLVVARSIFDPLTAFADDLSVHPFLAQKIEHDAEYRTWTITLRDNVQFHNGKPVTAAAVKAGQDYLMKSPVFGLAYSRVESFATDGDLRVVVHLKDRWVSFPSIMTGQVGMVADPDWLASNDSLHPVGTGPFVFETWQPGGKLVVTKNRDYWQFDAKGTRYPYLDSVEFNVIADTNARFAALRSGSANVIQGLGPAELKSFRDAGNASQYQVLTDERSETSELFVQLNTAAPPFDDIDARRALAYAIDRQEFVDTLSEGIFEPADGPFGQGSKYHGETGYPKYDPDKARQLVEQVKARHGGQFSFTVYGTSDTATILQFLQDKWASVGIDVKIDLMEQAKMIIQVVVGKYEATIWAGFDTPDPVIDSTFWDPQNVKPVNEISLNLARWSDPEVGQALKDAREGDDPQAVVEAYQRVARRMGDAVPYVWLQHSQSVIAGDLKLVNLAHVRLPDGAPGLPLQNGAHSLYQVWVRR